MSPVTLQAQLLRSGRRFAAGWTSPWSRRISTRWPESPVRITRSTTARWYASGTPTRTRAWRCWLTGSAVPSPQSNATCAASVASRRQRPSPQHVQLSTRSSPPRRLWSALPHQHPAARKRPSPGLVPSPQRSSAQDHECGPNSPNRPSHVTLCGQTPNAGSSLSSEARQFRISSARVPISSGQSSLADNCAAAPRMGRSPRSA
jgi:hypothetical protein